MRPLVGQVVFESTFRVDAWHDLTKSLRLQLGIIDVLTIVGVGQRVRHIRNTDCGDFSSVPSLSGVLIVPATQPRSLTTLAGTPQAIE